MAQFYHGISTRQVPTSISTPVVADTGVPFVVGTAPVHMVEGGKVNDPVLANVYEDAVTFLGYSEDFGKYTICEAIYTHFTLYGMAPIVFVNVLDPNKHKTKVDPADLNVIDDQVELPLEAIASTVTVKSAGGTEEKPATTYKADEDYTLFYDGGKLILEVLGDGNIPSNAALLNIGYTAVDPSQVSDSDIIGGFNVTTKKTSGLELIDSVFPKYSIIPDLIVVPGHSHKSEIAAIMGTKAEGLNTLFPAKALVDVDTTSAGVTYYTDVPAWKKRMNLFSPTQVVCWPLFKLGEKVVHASTHAAGLMAWVDNTINDGCPSESPSNKSLKIDSCVLADGTEVLLDLTQANYLNANGIVTALNFYGGYVLWGNNSACYPANTDPKDYFYCVSRTFDWVAKTMILSHWSKVDRKMNYRLVETIVQSVNLWLNGLAAEEKILGGRIEFRQDENPITSLLAGKMTFHVFLGVPVPAQEIEFILEYDISYLNTLFGVAA